MEEREPPKVFELLTGEGYDTRRLRHSEL